MGIVGAVLSGRLRRLVQPMGLIIYASAQWLLFAWFLANGGLASGGDFALAQAFAAPVFALMSMSLRQLWVSRQDGTGDYGRLVAMRGGTTLLAIFLVLGIAAATDAGIGTAPFALVLFLKSQEALADIFYAELDVQGRSHVAGLMLGIKGTIIVAVVVAGFLANLPVGLMGTVLAIGCGAVLLLELILARPRFGRASWMFLRDWRGCDALLAGVGWLSLANVLVALTGFLPRYALDILATRADVGLFAAVMMPVTVLLLAATGLSQSSLLELSRTVRSRDCEAFARLIRNLLVMMVLLTVGCAIAMLVAAATPLPRLFGVSPGLLGTAAGVTMLMTPAMIAQVVSYAYLPLRDFRTLSAINALALAVAAALAWPLLNIHVIYGGVVLACLPPLVQLTAFGVRLRRHFVARPLAV